MTCWDNHTEVIDGHLATVNSKGEIVDGRRFCDMDKERQQKVLDWISECIEPAKTISKLHNSYGLKHMMEHMNRVYTTNNQFKEAMLLSGYEPVDENELNWRFKYKMTPKFRKFRKDFYSGKYKY